MKTFLIFFIILIPSSFGIDPNIIYDYKEEVKEEKIKEEDEIMSINRDQLRTLIQEVLIDLEPAIPYSEEAVEQLMMTAAHESHLGTYLRQIGIKQHGYGGYGIFQIEISTHNDIWDRDLFEANDNFLSYKRHLELLANKYYNHNLSLEMNLMGNLPYQILIARFIYFRFKPPLPRKDDIYGLAEYYKKYYNTWRGKAKIDKVVKNYRRFAL